MGCDGPMCKIICVGPVGSWWLHMLALCHGKCTRPAADNSCSRMPSNKPRDKSCRREPRLGDFIFWLQSESASFIPALLSIFPPAICMMRTATRWLWLSKHLPWTVRCFAEWHSGHLEVPQPDRKADETSCWWTTAFNYWFTEASPVTTSRHPYFRVLLGFGKKRSPWVYIYCAWFYPVDPCGMILRFEPDLWSPIHPMFITISEVLVSNTAWHSLIRHDDPWPSYNFARLGVQNWVPRPSALALSVAALHRSEQSPWWGTPLGYHFKWWMNKSIKD